MKDRSSKRRVSRGWPDKKRLAWAQLFIEEIWYEKRPQSGDCQRDFFLTQSLRTILNGDARALRDMRVRLSHERRQIAPAVKLRRLQEELKEQRRRAAGPPPRDPQWAAA